MGQDWEQRRSLDPPDRQPATPEVRSENAEKPKDGAEKPKNGDKSDKDGGGGAFSESRLLLSRDLIALAFVLVLGVFALAVAFITPAEIAGAIGPVTTLVGTLVGLAFGAQVGGQGKQAEAEGRKNAEVLATEAIAKLPSDVAGPLVEKWRNSTLRGNPRIGDF